MDVLPISSLRDDDSLLFGNLNILLTKLSSSNIPIAKGLVVVPPIFRLKTILEYFDFGSNEVFEQSLDLVKKEFEKTPIPDELIIHTKNNKKFLVADQEIRSVKELWIILLNL